jgi:DNA-binding ferritin-like protein
MHRKRDGGDEMMFNANSIVGDHTKMIEEWRTLGSQCPELSYALVWTEFVTQLFQTFHWQVNGTTFFGDHLLFDRLYGEAASDIDPLAEKAVGIGGKISVDMSKRCEQVACLLDEYTSLGGAMFSVSLDVEHGYMNALEHVLNALQSTSMLTLGVENMLQGILDKHEGLVYLLNQRLSGK